MIGVTSSDSYWDVAALLFLTGLYMVVISALSSRLRSKHPAAWNATGSFTLFLNNSPASSVRFLKYIIFSNSFKELNDPIVNTMALLAKILFVGCMGIFVLGFFRVF